MILPFQTYRHYRAPLCFFLDWSEFSRQSQAQHGLPQNVQPQPRGDQHIRNFFQQPQIPRQQQPYQLPQMYAQQQQMHPQQQLQQQMHQLHPQQMNSNPILQQQAYLRQAQLQNQIRHQQQLQQQQQQQQYNLQKRQPQPPAYQMPAPPQHNVHQQLVPAAENRGGPVAPPNMMAYNTQPVTAHAGPRYQLPIAGQPHFQPQQPQVIPPVQHTVQNQAQINQIRPQVNQSRPQMDQIRTRLTQNQPQMDQNRPQMNQNRPQASQNHPQVNQNQPQASQNRGQLNQIRPHSSQICPQYNQIRPHSSQNWPQYNQNRPQAGLAPRMQRPTLNTQLNQSSLTPGNFLYNI